MRKFANYAARILSFQRILSIMVSRIEIRVVCVMKRKNTDQLLKELMDSNDLSRVLSDNSACFREGDLPHGLQMLFDQQDMSKSALAKASGISEVYLHQVFAGRRNPSRDRLLCICVGLGITLDETQRMLTQGGYAQLYPRTRRDAIISYGVVHQLPLGEINDKLFAEQEKTLF